ncbi:uncharacterized protein SPPG_00014 [Spizellomyces punctatus DAOM BR117]|uniref:Uncharacterized protein n=1 Tax=Spizellomyces punctatus (strain DAOM BR117) TaxID=645134 RepID=A0A0L0HSE4_SPIPD|nr:uncharacterized protein SPPG_00014 [Spizellomyces punctatus DAOM BR117]KND04276.1 hypothetical protein SPPG_00014 [Spizellomyces punctatus DAOM BR117]|eukprot:XP_016612315.1 hypothetical protein SPPG_00014 [Spizellomyces punctatus DAOM BR117]
MARAAENHGQLDGRYMFHVIWVMLACPLLAIILLLFQMRLQWPSPTFSSALLCLLFFIFLCIAYVAIPVGGLKYFATPDVPLANARMLAPTELGITWLSIVGLQVEFRYKAFTSIVYLICGRIAARWIFAPAFLFGGDWEPALQLALGVVLTLRSAYVREWRTKISYLFAPDGSSSANNSLPEISRDGRSRCWLIPTWMTAAKLHVLRQYRLAMAQKFDDADLERRFCIEYSGSSLVDARITYLSTIASAWLSFLGLFVKYHSNEPLDFWMLMGFGAIIPGACLVALGLTWIPGLGKVRPRRQQICVTLCYLLIQAANLGLIRHGSLVLQESTDGGHHGAALAGCISALFLHINFMIARSSSECVRGPYAVACAGIDLSAAVLIPMMAKTEKAYTLIFVYGCAGLVVGGVLSPWTERTQRKYFQTVKLRLQQPSEEKRKGKKKKRGVPDQISTVGTTTVQELSPTEKRTLKCLQGSEARLGPFGSGILKSEPMQDAGPATPMTEMAEDDVKLSMSRRLLYGDDIA